MSAICVLGQELDPQLVKCKGMSEGTDMSHSFCSLRQRSTTKKTDGRYGIPAIVEIQRIEDNDSAKSRRLTKLRRNEPLYVGDTLYV